MFLRSSILSQMSQTPTIIPTQIDKRSRLIPTSSMSHDLAGCAFFLPFSTERHSGWYVMSLLKGRRIAENILISHPHKNLVLLLPRNEISLSFFLFPTRINFFAISWEPYFLLSLTYSKRTKKKTFLDHLKNLPHFSYDRVVPFFESSIGKSGVAFNVFCQ